MDLPVAPPAFDATTGPRQRSRADLGADIGAGCGLVFLELIALAVIFWLWFLSGFNLDPARTVMTLICVIVFGGAAAQSQQDQLCRDIPSATGCKGGDD
ncbi:DUF6234 family protein [Streptomyces murinus]|uniref:DUF6234 family protein n=1 Tax=Streptomyces murinus TaxID=33900 RepID=UPI003F46B467